MPGCDGTAVANGSYPTSEVRGCGQEEPPHARGQGGGREELPRIGGQGRPGGATPCPRSGIVAGRSHPAPEARGGGKEITLVQDKEEQHLCFAGAAVK